MIIGEKFEINILEIPIGSSLIHIESIQYLENDNVLECSEAWQVASDWKFDISVDH